MLELYFIRHGQSTNNLLTEDGSDTYLSQRSTDPDLTPIGEEQARLVAEAIARPYVNNGYDPQNRSGFGLTHLYCSLMTRAVKTGLAIAEKTGLPLVAWPELHETGGLFDVEFIDEEPVLIGQPGPGRSYFQSNFPQLIIPDDLPETGWYNREKEPREHYPVRAREIVNRLLSEHGGTDHRVGIVMHGGIFGHILTAFFEIQAEHYWFQMNNCAISRVDISDKGHVRLQYTNKVDPFPDHLVT
ncbi:MAG TPA: histidine phosphatase family protein [Brevefilum fermentans]|jgi:2,3-bisphosphoglycerate-dependent phosphoglycerate mutase|uniref:Putative Phosphoglycerate mutase family protein n=1 Tax=Candidatus Brevifilum fermentans TaxID=1986204 RepID=A0A1Y6K4K9_9CHLR|nr:histidine phosphatase family protein [Brevefilum fermentans]MDI9566181.1 histidine phosphatase family protein [Chloroflexota bacterium]OQB84389.1 MAG: phosphoglycerate mutase [Chloroflexi bacterium ADurb.Bin120]SMX53798.1 putative Phosphoglycerate mutase family protein [Brevefilum fermentans]HOM66730.1 histidine phosphatase family protein [Brevefilum fermentans]HPX95362.1 histidine phosphatase family protein [Brevefilum fermentans]